LKRKSKDRIILDYPRARFVESGRLAPLSRDEIDRIIADFLRGAGRAVGDMQCKWFYDVSPPAQLPQS
jgi:hypothetical protein